MPDTKVSLATALTSPQSMANVSFPVYRSGAAPNDFRVTFRELQRMLKYNTHWITPTGDPAVDTPEWEALVEAVNTTTPAGRSSEIVIRDNGLPLALDSAYSAADGAPNTSEFLRGCFVRGETRNSEIRFSNYYIINWGRYGNPIRLTDTTGYPWFERGTISPMTAFSSRVIPSGVTLAKGDWVLVWSDDNIAGVAAHEGTGGFQRSAELHRVSHQDGGGWVLDGDVVDPLTTNPRICKIEMLRGCGIADLRLSSTHVETTTPISETDQISSINVQRCVGFIGENVEVDESGCGGFDVQLCGDGRVSGYNGLHQVNARRNYALTIGVCTSFTYEDSVWHNCRHMITTGGLQVTPGDGIRYGTARNCRGVNLDQYVSGDAQDNAFAAMDLHAESWGFELRDCSVYGSMYWDGGAEQFFAFSTRARNTRFVNCYNHSAMTQSIPANMETYYGQVHVGWRIMANDAHLINCHQDRGWMGVLIQPDTQDTGFIPQRTKIYKGLFENITGGAIHMQNAIAANGIEMSHSIVRDCANRYNPGGVPEFRSAIIRVLGGTGHKFRFNDFDKSLNNYTLDVDALTPSNLDFAYNSCRGYGSGKIGVRGDIGDPKSASTTSGPSINSAFAAKNNTD